MLRTNSHRRCISIPSTRTSSLFPSHSPLSFLSFFFHFSVLSILLQSFHFRWILFHFILSDFSRLHHSHLHSFSITFFLFFAFLSRPSVPSMSLLSSWRFGFVACFLFPNSAILPFFIFLFPLFVQSCLHFFLPSFPFLSFFMNPVPAFITRPSLDSITHSHVVIIPLLCFPSFPFHLHLSHSSSFGLPFISSFPSIILLSISVLPFIHLFFPLLQSLSLMFILFFFSFHIFL